MPPRPGPLAVPAAQLPPRRRRRLGWLVLVLVIALLALAIFAAIVARREIVAMLPGAAQLYALAGLSPAPPGPGLELAKVAPTRTADGLIIEGEVSNPGGTVRDVPRLRVALRDPAEKEVEFKIIDPPKAQLLPGETAHFKTSFDHPDEAATGVVVTFAKR
jgi:Protein of unknown function (DUF3426)